MKDERTISPMPASSPRSSYDPIYFSPLFAIEDRHFWFRARNRVIACLVRQALASLPPNYRVLEVGCGTGNVLRLLEQNCKDGMVVGMDLFFEGLQYARLRTSCALVQGDVEASPFATQFALIGLFDVLEHLPNDVKVLHDLHAMLASEGILLLTVPAHPLLWSYFDEASHHYRRYNLQELESKLTDTGYRVEYLTEYMAGIFPLAWLGRRLASIVDRYLKATPRRSDDLATAELSIKPVINDLVGWLLALEAIFITRRCRLPFGASLLAIARKDLVSNSGERLEGTNFVAKVEEDVHHSQNS